MLFFDRVLDFFDNIADVAVGNPRTAREAKSTGKQAFADAVDVGGRGCVDWLAVHWFPEGAAFDAGGIEGDAHCLDICSGLALGVGAFGLVGDTGRSADGAFNDLGISIFLTLDFQGRVERDGAKPKIGVEPRGWILVEGNAPDIGKQIAIKGLDMVVVIDVLLKDGHLSSPDTGANIAHAVVVADFLVLVIGV